MTVAPPFSRLHLAPAFVGTGLLCLAFAWPAAAAPPDGKGPGAHTPPAQAKRSPVAPLKRSARPGRAKRSAPQGQTQRSAAPGQVKRSITVQPAPGPQLAPDAPAPARSRATARAVTGRRQAVSSRRAVAAERVRRVQAERPPLRITAPPLSPSAERTRPRKERSRQPAPVTGQDEPPQPLRVVQDIVEVVPTPLRVLLAGLGALSILLAVASGLTLLRNRRLARERRQLLGEVGLLQAALLPELPDNLAACRVSVAYRPADGPGAGGDFYDVFPVGGGRTAVLIGDVSGHGREALGRTALARYTLRAYTEAGLEPHEALQIAGAVMAGKLEGDFVTALLATYDAAGGTLTYATAGHPPPIVVARSEFQPVLVGTPPPLGVGTGTGQRQTTLPFPRGSVACFYTDGLSEANTADGRLGSERLERLVSDLGPDVTAEEVIDGVTASAHTIADDAAVCVITATDGVGILRSRVERLEISRAELRGPLLGDFLRACGVSIHGVRVAERDAREVAGRMGGAHVEVRLGDSPQVDVLAPELPLSDDVGASLPQPSRPIE